MPKQVKAGPGPRHVARERGDVTNAMTERLAQVRESMADDREIRAIVQSHSNIYAERHAALMERLPAIQARYDAAKLGDYRPTNTVRPDKPEPKYLSAEVPTRSIARPRAASKVKVQDANSAYRIGRFTSDKRGWRALPRTS